MLKRLTTAFLIVLLSFALSAEGLSSFPSKDSPSKDVILKDFSWKAGVEEIKATEKTEPQLEATDFLVYELALFNKPVQKIYSFNNNQLTTVFYIFNELPSELKGFLTDYEAVNTELETLLGAPLSVNERWEDERFKAFPELALALGDLTFSSIWVSGIDSLLTHSLYANDLSITHVIFLNPIEDLLRDLEFESEPDEPASELEVEEETQEAATTEETLLEEPLLNE
ncbi:MAG: hypothetical protein PHD88_04005 [Firmicutes bacterium]|nr:hypothetical protein [Bacillota bacterium]